MGSPSSGVRPTSDDVAGLDSFPYATFSRQEWARLREATPLTLTDQELTSLRGTSEYVSLDEVRDIYLPLSRLLTKGPDHRVEQVRLRRL